MDKLLLRLENQPDIAILEKKNIFKKSIIKNIFVKKHFLLKKFSKKNL